MGGGGGGRTIGGGEGNEWVLNHSLSISTPPFRILFKPRREIASLIGDIYFSIHYYGDFSFSFFLAVGFFIFFCVSSCVSSAGVFLRGDLPVSLLLFFFTHLA